jgi:Na+-transporting methylmalonyl-CoA/oxaloacetate decarboxylase gamma subunit
MTVSEGLLVALFCISMVFFVLLCLCFLIKLFSFLLIAVSGKKKPEPEPASPQPAPAAEEEFSSGTLKLHEVDEPTAAMIMAIVSDESGIPLSELCFKSIKLVQK